MTEETFKQKRATYRKQLFDSSYFALIGIAIFGYAIKNFIEMNTERYFFESYNVPRILGWFFDKFGPLPTTILMFVIALAFIAYFISRAIKYRKNITDLKLEYSPQTS